MKTIGSYEDQGTICEFLLIRVFLLLLILRFWLDHVLEYVDDPSLASLIDGTYLNDPLDDTDPTPDDDDIDTSLDDSIDTESAGLSLMLDAMTADLKNLKIPGIDIRIYHLSKMHGTSSNTNLSARKRHKNNSLPDLFGASSIH